MLVSMKPGVYEQHTPYDGSAGGEGEGRMLDGCYHVYLDMGTNVGIQIRKLYQPHLFPKAGVLPLFDKYFGPYSQRYVLMLNI